MFSKTAKEKREIHHRKRELLAMMHSAASAEMRRAAYEEYERHCARHYELNESPDTHTCFCCGDEFTADTAHLKFPIPTLVICDKTGRPISQTDYGIRHMGAACEGCMERVKAYMEAQD